MTAKNCVIAAALAFAVAFGRSPGAHARDARTGVESPQATRAATQPGKSSGRRGHPKVLLDHLDLTKAPLPASEEKYLREVLAKEARRADWGAGRRSQIQYRFRVDELEVVEEPSVIRIHCAATGWLPKGKTAKSRLSFGGAPKERTELVRKVLAIVARGVVTRLADLERERRAPANK